MAVPDLSNLRAVVADDRPDARDMVTAKLRELGVTRIESVAAGVAGPGFVTVMTDAVMVGVPEPASPDQIVDLVARFTHDVTSPLTSALLLSRFLATAGNGANEDAQRIHAAIEEVAGMVRTLTVRVASASGLRRPGGS
jgi:hypothetical protein